MGGNRAADTGASAAATKTTGTMVTTGILETMARMETMKDKGGGAAATVTATSEVRTWG